MLLFVVSEMFLVRPNLKFRKQFKVQKLNKTKKKLLLQFINEPQVKEAKKKILCFFGHKYI